MKILSPLERYQLDLEREDFRKDLAQERAVQRLQVLHDVLIAQYNQGQKKSWWRHLLSRTFLSRLFFRSTEKIKGVYFWGGVGRGKTYLMDNFFESLPFQQKARMHFHRFMRRVHSELKLLDGQKNPLKIVAEIISREARVICFDEFFVSDITDAMILGLLMTELFERGVVLVATSNIIPDDLYKDGLQRSRFIPAIAVLKQNVDVINVDGGVDYRLRSLEQAPLFYLSTDKNSDVRMQTVFRQLLASPADERADQILMIEGRPIHSRFSGEGVVWFEFVAICDGPRSQNDYIELSKEFHSVFISHIPSLGRKNDDQARRFINLVDEFYDRQVKLIISAINPIAELYSDGKLNFEFQRTVSRLLEMQSLEYLAKPHRP